MFLTLDNLRNPMIALRQILPFRLLNALGVVPYHVGSTFGPRGLGNVVCQAGFEVIDTASLMHCPRMIAVAITRLMQRYAKPPAQQKFLRGLMAFERLSQLPTHTVTGHFTAVRVVKLRCSDKKNRVIVHRLGNFFTNRKIIALLTNFNI